MKKNPISAIAGWKSAALLALVAMVAAVAFSGVLTNSNAADAQNGPALSAEYAYEFSNDDTDNDLDVTVTLTGYLAPAPADPAITAWYLTVVEDGDDTTPTCQTGAVDGTDGSVGTYAANDLKSSTKYDITAYASDDSSCADDAIATAQITTPSVTLTEDGTVTPGEDKDVTVNLTGRQRFSLSDDGATGSFAANGKTTLTCSDGDNCDRNVATGLMTIRVAVGEESKTGQHLYFTHQTPGATTTSDIVLTVADPEPQPASFSVAPAKGDETAAAGTGTSTIVVTVMDDTTPVAKPYVGDINVSFITPNGKVVCAEDADPQNTCSTSETNADGQATATLSGGVPGTATITVLVGKLGAGSTEVTFFGEAANLAADAPQSSINLGGGAFVTFTVTDADDRPVKGADITQPVVDKVITPDVDDAVAVAVALVQDDDANTADDPPKGAVYCGNDAGTNAAGQCVVRVSSAAEAPAAATRGDHTLNFQLVVDATTTLKAEVVMTVAGPSDSISHDAPSRIDALDEIEVTLTVTDDAGNRVGTQPVSVTKVEGGGAILDGEKGDTANGEAKFTFLASSLEGNVVFVVRSGDARAVITVAVGPEPVVEEEPEPEAPPATWNNQLVSGQNLVVWNGEDGADPSAGSDMGVSAIWSYNTGSGTWDGYFPNAADVPGGNTLTSLSNGDAYFVIVE